jgi:hypothetical protein
MIWIVTHKFTLGGNKRKVKRREQREVQRLIEQEKQDGDD